MSTKRERILMRDGTFGYLVRQVGGGVTPLYIAMTVDGYERIVAATDFIRTEWDGIDRRKTQRRRAQVPRDASQRERRQAERRQGQRRQFVVQRP